MNQSQAPYHTLPQDCPPRLRKVIEKHKYKFHRIAHELRINPGHVHNYITAGIEPQRADIRQKMHLPKSKRAKRKADYRPEYMNWWRHLTVKERHEIIKREHERQKTP